MFCPQTPKRKRKSSTTSIISPHFPPTCKQRSYASTNCLPPSDLLVPCAVTTNPTAHQQTDTFEASHTEDDDHLELVGDPLSCCHLCPFVTTFRHLLLVKPVLIQERVAEDPWKLLVAVTLLNKTAGKLAIPVFWRIMQRWPTPWTLSQAQESDLVAVIFRLGTQTVRAKRLISLSRAYLQDPPCPRDLRPSKSIQTSLDSPSPLKRDRYPATPISHLPGTGPYALDSYRIFCTVSNDPSSEEWKTVVPSDKELIRYLTWKWAFVARKEWNPTQGVVRSIDLRYLKNLVLELRQ